MVRSKRTKLREVEESPSEENTEPEFESKDEDEIEEPVAKKAKSDSDDEPEEEETEENIATPEESEESKSEAGGNEENKDTEMSVDNPKPDDSNDSQGLDEETKPKGKKERSPDLAKFWKAVEDDPQDFTGWTYLLQFVDTTGDIDDGREAYDAFLHRYPYCYGYWKKYADLEKRKGLKDRVMMVFERGITAITLSADLWIHYLNHVKSEFGSKPEFVRAQYERSIEGCGKEWRSDKLWDHYVKWETTLESEKEIGTKNYSKVLALYDRILGNPTQGLTHQFDMFKEFVKVHEPKDMMEPEDFLELRKEVLKDQEEEKEELNAEENYNMRERIIAIRKKIFKSTEEKVQLRWKFEDAIKRPYFHMKPLERGQLKNWSEYLEFEEKEANKKEDFSNLTVLFERCMIACALYEEFWLKYVNWLIRAEPKMADGEEKIRDVYKRACQNHLPGKVEIHLQWAAFEEQRGYIDNAREILENCEQKHPHLMSVLLRRINLERRCGNVQSVHSLYKSCIAKAKNANSRVELAIKYARYLRLVLKDNSAAKDILTNLLDQEENEKNCKLYMQLLDTEIHSSPLNVESVINILDKAITTEEMPIRQKLMFSQRKIEFLEDFGNRVDQLTKTKDDHEKLAEVMKKEAKVDERSNRNSVDEKQSKNHPKNGADPTTTTYGATNSAAYGAAHASNYDQYGSRYNYNQYYQGYYQPSY